MSYRSSLVLIPALSFVLSMSAIADITLNAGADINMTGSPGSTIIFPDGSVQSTAATGGTIPAGHGGTGNTVSGTDAFVGGGSNNTASGYISTVGGGYNPEWDEEIEIIEMPMTEVREKLQVGFFTDAKTIVGLYALLNYIKVQKS